MHFHCRTWTWTWCPVQCVPLFPAPCPDSFEVHFKLQPECRQTKARSNAQCLYNGRVWQWWGHKQGGTRMEGRGAQSCLLPIVSLSTSCALSHWYPRIALLSMLFSFWETAIFELAIFSKGSSKYFILILGFKQLWIGISSLPSFERKRIWIAGTVQWLSSQKKSLSVEVKPD